MCDDDIARCCAAHAPVSENGRFSIGTVFGDWRLTAFVGRGGTGEVYCAEHVALGSPAAVKVLTRDDDRAKMRFKHEAKLLAGLRSEAFPRFYSYGEANGTTYLAMELLEPGELPTADHAVAKFMIKVCDAVAELHAQGLVHRDIKPANILWREASPVLVDLGLVKEASQPPNNLTALQPDNPPTLAGTPGYGAPEQMERGEATFAADVHALGVMADHCFGGRPPRAWTRIVERATSSIPGRRYSSVAAFVRTIRCRHLTRYLVGLIVFSSAMLAVLSIKPRHVDSDDEQKAVVSVEYTQQESPLKLNSVTRLDGGKLVLAEPIVLEAGREYQIYGPGTLDANLFCPTTAIVRLKNCVLLNRTKRLYPENGIQYRLENGVYLNFIDVREKPSRLDVMDFIGPFDGAYNEVRFGGPETIQELRDQMYNEWIRDLQEIQQRW